MIKKIKQKKKKETIKQKLDRIIQLLSEINNKLPFQPPTYYTHTGASGYTCPRCYQFVPSGVSHYC